MLHLLLPPREPSSKAGQAASIHPLLLLLVGGWEGPHQAVGDGPGLGGRGSHLGGSHLDLLLLLLGAGLSAEAEEPQGRSLEESCRQQWWLLLPPPPLLPVHPALLTQWGAVRDLPVAGGGSQPLLQAVGPLHLLLLRLSVPPGQQQETTPLLLQQEVSS